MGDKADEHPVTDDLGVEPRRAVDVPERLDPLVEHHPYSELVHPRLHEMGHHPTGPQGRDHSGGAFPVHARHTSFAYGDR
ncbi:hypothetical protein ACFVIM_25165 [Streptomyces sp. NPDC057638]|uniref:hypothetical protein n=1 Tax=Streptomyces sp. NPDC057638 TaxID=3346190 RepID=UPI0036897B1A